MRIALTLEYDGTHYFGWQRQLFDQLSTLQEKCEQAISRVADHPVEIVAAGRTDAGVHATGQVVHFDTTSYREERAWLLGINTYLPDDIRVHVVQKVSDDFHARFSATARRYQYLIYNAPVKSAIMRHHATVVYPWLDVEKMHEAAQCFVGEHNFTSLRAVACQAKTPFRRIDYITVQRSGSWVTVEVQANAFLHHMVRNLIGVLLPIGMGKQKIEWADTVLKAIDRRQAGITAPPEGLYLVKVLYEK